MQLHLQIIDGNLGMNTHTDSHFKKSSFSSRTRRYSDYVRSVQLRVFYT